MAEPHSLQVGDWVTHPEWPPGTVRKIVRFSPFQRMGWVKGRRRLIPDPGVRIVHLHAPVHEAGIGDEDAWMEAGLVPANRLGIATTEGRADG